jgi:hypothetical protein
VPALSLNPAWHACYHERRRHAKESLIHLALEALAKYTAYKRSKTTSDIGTSGYLAVLAQ